MYSKIKYANLETFGSNPHFAGPDEWRSAEFEDYGTFVTIDEAIEEVDMMFLRVQHDERHDYESLFLKKTTIVFADSRTLSDRMKDTAIVTQHQ